MEEEEGLRNFLAQVVHPLMDDEVYVVLGAYRKKYYSGLPRSHEVVVRELVRSNDLADLVTATNRVEAVLRVTRVDGLVPPPEAGVVYLDLNPKSVFAGYHSFVTEINKYVSYALNDQSYDRSVARRLDKKLLSEVHKATSRKLYLLVDLDLSDQGLLVQLVQDLRPHVRWISKTHGGYHIITDNNKQVGSTLHQQYKDAPVELKRQVLTPVPYTKQGGFKVVPVPLEEVVE